jgi:hypothetical protein
VPAAQPVLPGRPAAWPARWGPPGRRGRRGRPGCRGCPGCRMSARWEWRGWAAGAARGRGPGRRRPAAASCAVPGSVLPLSRRARCRPLLVHDGAQDRAVLVGDAAVPVVVAGDGGPVGGAGPGQAVDEVPAGSADARVHCGTSGLWASGVPGVSRGTRPLGSCRAAREVSSSGCTHIRAAGRVSIWCRLTVLLADGDPDVAVLVVDVGDPAAVAVAARPRRSSGRSAGAAPGSGPACRAPAPGEGSARARDGPASSSPSVRSTAPPPVLSSSTDRPRSPLSEPRCSTVMSTSLSPGASGSGSMPGAPPAGAPPTRPTRAVRGGFPRSGRYSWPRGLVVPRPAENRKRYIWPLVSRRMTPPCPSSPTSV